MVIFQQLTTMFLGLIAMAIIILTIIHFQMRLNRMLTTIRKPKKLTQINLLSSKIRKSNLFKLALSIRI